MVVATLSGCCNTNAACACVSVPGRIVTVLTNDAPARPAAITAGISGHRRRAVKATIGISRYAGLQSASASSAANTHGDPASASAVATNATAMVIAWGEYDAKRNSVIGISAHAQTIHCRWGRMRI